MDTLATSIAWVSRLITEVAITSASPAVSSGISEANSAPPNTTSRMISAAITPTATDSPGPALSWLEIAFPPRETCIDGPSADSAAWTRFRASASVTFEGTLSHVTLANATVPSWLICAAPAAL